MYVTSTKFGYVANITYRSSISEKITICYRPGDNIPNHQPTRNPESQNCIDNKDTASGSGEEKQSQLSDPMQKQMPCTPAQTPNKVNPYKNNDNTKGDTQEDTVWGGVQKIYLDYFRDLEGHSEAKTGLPEPMKDHGEAKIDSPQPADTVAVSKHVLPVTQGIFIRPLYLFSNTNK